MARVLVCWELGAGLGHIGPLLAGAETLRGRGHTVLFAIRDTHDPGDLLAQRGFDYLQAPVPVPTQAASTPAIHTWPQVLLSVGFHTPRALAARLRAWRRLFELVAPDVLVCEHAPSALLAARGLGVRRLVTGATGFIVPPSLPSYPDLRLPPADPGLLARDEQRLLDVMNAALGSLGEPPFACAGELFAEAAAYIATLPELDPYAGCAPREYVGPANIRGLPSPEWPDGEGPRLFVYVQRFPTLPALLDILRQTRCRALVQVAGLERPPPEFENTPHLRFLAGPVDLPAAAQTADLGISHGGGTTAATFLCAGKPQLLLPYHFEQLLTSEAVARLGAGLVAPQRHPEGMRAKLARLLADPAFTEAARTVAARHAGLDPERPVRRLVEAVEQASTTPRVAVTSTNAIGGG
ncbi:MAG TPA: nucleotide disphospho-sugar-binding domain-containing protein [Gammaproteobacteria bacterium]|nr:nucleotide disphospho-sugar-binding domain-containing protein [Gammaproteobacteria bacterium]